MHRSLSPTPGYTALEGVPGMLIAGNILRPHMRYERLFVVSGNAMLAAFQGGFQVIEP